MEAKRWTIGVVLAAVVSLFGLIQADASPFSTYILSDDLGNRVNGTAPEASDGVGSDDTDGSTSGSDADGKDNNGHGNNVDGVDSSNKGNSKQDEDTLCADGTFCDDETRTATSTEETTSSGEETKTNKGKKK